LKAFLNKGLKY